MHGKWHQSPNNHWQSSAVRRINFFIKFTGFNSRFQKLLKEIIGKINKLCKTVLTQKTYELMLYFEFVLKISDCIFKETCNSS